MRRLDQQAGLRRCVGILWLRRPAVVPVALLAVAPFRIPIQLGKQDAFLLLPLYLVLAASVLAVAYRMVRGWTPPPPPLFLALPTAVFVAYTSLSFLWTYDLHEGGIELAFFVFPFMAGFGVVARTPVAPWLGRALAVTLVALGSLFAAIGLWEAHSHRLIFARDVQVANAYTSFFRVTSLFKDPSLYGRYLVLPIALLLVALLVRRGRSLEWIPLAALIAFLFAGLYYSYSQSSFVALFCVTFAIAFLAVGRRLRTFLLVCAAIAAAAPTVTSASPARSVNSSLTSASPTSDRPIPAVAMPSRPKPRSGATRPRGSSTSTAPRAPTSAANWAASACSTGRNVTRLPARTRRFQLSC